MISEFLDKVNELKTFVHSESRIRGELTADRDQAANKVKLLSMEVETAKAIDNAERLKNAQERLEEAEKDLERANEALEWCSPVDLATQCCEIALRTNQELTERMTAARERVDQLKREYQASIDELREISQAANAVATTLEWVYRHNPKHLRIGRLPVPRWKNFQIDV